MKKLAIFHFNALELFPPSMNIVNYLEDYGGFDIRVYTTNPKKGFSKFQSSGEGSVRIRRYGQNNSQRSPLMRFLVYVWHYGASIVDCLFWRPSVLFSIETISSPVPILLKKYLLRRSALFIHYHEYMSSDDYKISGLLNAIHRMEKQVYPDAVWISHTNQDRMRLFRRDNPGLIEDSQCHIMPNYPSMKWSEGNRRSGWIYREPLRIVYVGALDLNNMYFPEFLQWVSSQDGRCSLDIFSNQDMKGMEDYIRMNYYQHIYMRKSIPYFDLPAVLNKYDVGVILYKGDSENFMFNAPNKLFEYLAVGLDVWYYEKLEGVRPYVNNNTHPMVIPVDFENLEKMKVQEIYGVDQRKFSPSTYYAEQVYGELAVQLSEM